MYDRKVIRRRRAVLAALVVLSVILLTGYFGEASGGLLHGISRGAQQVLKPIEKGASTAAKPFRDLFNFFGDAFDAKSENKELKRDLARARRQLALAQTAVRDNEQLRALTNLPQRPGFPQGTDPVTARVIARSPTDWYSTIQVDKGRGDGIREDQPVITGDGLVGKVSSVTSGAATITLITDGSVAVSSEVMPVGANGTLRPAVGDPNDLQLDFVRKGRLIRKGQVVVTSGFRSGRLESLYPRGVPIGRVKSVSPNEIETYQRVHVQPYADFHRIDYVQILTARPAGTQQASLVPEQ
ncbi:MAG TPA: rod shape-determining protein MreC [Thermoleophilaceae bacterium]|nr:rod shape-determining protein MreC [Thermoleophilaceae bacterium]